MANVKLTAGVPKELYLDAGLTVGNQILIQNSHSTTLKASGSESGLSSDYINILPQHSAVNENGDLEAWVVSFNDAVINVIEV